MSEKQGQPGSNEPGSGNDQLPAGSRPSRKTLLLVGAIIVGAFCLPGLVVIVAWSFAR